MKAECSYWYDDGKVKARYSFQINADSLDDAIKRLKAIKADAVVDGWPSYRYPDWISLPVCLLLSKVRHWFSVDK